MKTILQSTLSKVIGVSLISLLMSACGGSATIVITPDLPTHFNGSWQSDCIYISSTDTSEIETLYITDTEYTLFINEFDNHDCFGASDFETEIEGYLYFGHYRPSASNYCDDVIEVDFAADAVYEDGYKIPHYEIASYLGLPDKTTYDLMCTEAGHLYRGDFRMYNGTRPSERPVSIDYHSPFHGFN